MVNGWYFDPQSINHLKETRHDEFMTFRGKWNG